LNSSSVIFQEPAKPEIFVPFSFRFIKSFTASSIDTGRLNPINCSIFSSTQTFQRTASKSQLAIEKNNKKLQKERREDWRFQKIVR
jgi:hypothetical protein